MTNQTISNKLVDKLESAGVNFFVSVPCKLLAGQIRLLSDDVLANDSFSDFCRMHQLSSVNVYNLGAARAHIC